VIARELRLEEREAAVRGRLELEGYRFARDALLIVVHPSNPVENVAIDEIRRIYQGDLTRWSTLGGTNSPVEPVVQPLGSDIEAFFDHAVMGNEPVTAPSHRAESDSAVIQLVLQNPRAIGYVSLSSDSAGAKVLRVASLTGLPYWKPDLEAIYRGDYPLTRFLNAYVRSSGPKLSHGLITFLTSIDGQRLVYESGYVPTAVPVRFVRRSAMLEAHP